MIKLLKYLKPFKNYAIASVFLVVSSEVLALILPIFSRKLINDGIQADGGPYRDVILQVGIQMIGLTLLSIVITILNSYCTTKTASGYSMTLRKEIFAKVQNLSYSDVNKFGVPSLITRSSNDIIQVQNMILQTLNTIITVPIMFFGGGIMAIAMNPKLSKIILIIIPLLAVLVLVVLYFVLPLFNQMQKKTDKLNQVVREKLSGTRVIRAFNKTEYTDGLFDTANFELTSIALKIQKILAALLPVAIVLAFGIVGFLLWYIGRSANGYDPTIAAEKKKLLGTIGDMSAFISYFIMVIGAVTMATGVFAAIPKAQISSRRILAILDLESEIQEPEEPKHIDENQKGIVEFSNVSFKYPEKVPEDEGKKGLMYKLATRTPNDKKNKKPAEDKEKAKAEKAAVEETKKASAELLPSEEELKNHVDLENISFTSHPGEITAIIGSTGCGKSTLVNLIPRMYDVTEGEIKIGGVNIKDLSFDELYSSIAIIPQKAFLFSGTIAENLRYGKPDATEEEMDKALEIAQAKTFVDKMTDGKESFISQSATNLSGGQKQRLAIARAVIKKANICIFDDSFSALDLATDAKLRKAIRENMSNSNIIIVAQRVGTVLDADRIIVLDKGHMVGIGTHHELMESCEIYREIVATQLSPEEVAAI